MFSWSKRRAALRALGRKVPLKAVSDLQSVFLLQMMIGLSQVLNDGATQAETRARTLVLDSQQRLRALRQAMPYLDLSFDRLLSRVGPNKTPDDPLSPEESAVQAMLEMCLGLILRLLSKPGGHFSARAPYILGKIAISFDVPLLPCFSSQYPLFRARSCLIS